ncbi:hypothetical protein DPMN_150701 [Dreissena polymorpha]|uniref:Uncharacterized protein n=1 Tax=Dreissena polymorpha TaxID=45954 RepID=A0A9D4FI66_DREPO|nr:hypothetical protein DPMN_150701 [Dreissena polymorpha]
MRMKQAANETLQENYERGVADLQQRLVEYYNDNSSKVPLSILNQGLDKRITDIYERPKIHRVKIGKDGKRQKRIKY